MPITVTILEVNWFDSGNSTWCPSVESPNNINRTVNVQKKSGSLKTEKDAKTIGCFKEEGRIKDPQNLTLTAMLCWNVTKDIKTNNTFITVWSIEISIQLLLILLLWSSALWLETDGISSFASSHKHISLCKKNRATLMCCPQRRRCPDYLIQCRCFCIKDALMGALAHLHHKTLGWRDKQVWAKAHTHTQIPAIKFVCQLRSEITNLISGMFAKFLDSICLLADCGEWDMSRVNKSTDIPVW